MSKIIETEVNMFLSKPWQKFFTRFIEIDILKNSKWSEVHQLAYICKRYETFYGRKFIFSMKNAPSKCLELVLVKKMPTLSCFVLKIM